MSNRTKGGQDMPGPNSLPNGDKRRWDELNEIVCDVHFYCKMEEFDAKGKPVTHDYITYRVWLLRRNRLTTGKTR
jgi:hypothetical protein